MRQTWKNSEVDCVIRHIRNNPHNLQTAFENAGKEIGKTSKAVSGKYYQHLKKSKVMFELVGAGNKSTGLNNVKNVESRTEDSNFNYSLIKSLYNKLSVKQKENLIIELVNLI